MVYFRHEQFHYWKYYPCSCVTNLSVTNAKMGSGSTNVVSWKKAANADSYFVEVRKGDGTYYVNKTIKGADNTSYQTDVLYTADTYTVSVTAKNSGGSSPITSTTFEVMPDLSVSFDSGIGDPEIRSIHYNGEVTTPNAPDREGYRFDGWVNDSTNLIIKSTTKVSGIKEDQTYTAKWTPKNYTINIVDGINNKTIRTTSQPFDSEFNVSEFMDNSALPAHDFYEFVGYSENIYKVKAEIHTIYARYKWASEYNLGTKITSIQRAKSAQSKTTNDGYSIDIEVTAPKSTDEMGTDQTLKGRVVVALKTDAGRLLIETESSAFVLYPKDDEPVTRTINVFVPYEATSDDQLATAIEAYVVNNYYTAGIVSNIATNNAELLKANAEDDYLFSSTPVKLNDVIDEKHVIEVAPDRDYYTYTLTTTERKESLEPALDNYVLDSSATKWSDPLWSDQFEYASSWPSLGNAMYSGFDNTSGVGKELYTRFNRTPVSASETDTMKVAVYNSPEPVAWIYYHWCRNNQSPSTKQRAVYDYKTDTANNTRHYHTFHAFYSTWDIGKQTYADKTYYYQNYDGACKDSYYWANRIPVYYENWATYKKIFTHTKSEVTNNIIAHSLDEISALNNPMEIIPSKTVVDDSYPKNSITLYTREGKQTSDIVHHYAYRSENNTITHEDTHVINNVSGSVGNEYAETSAILYIQIKSSIRFHNGIYWKRRH